MVQGTPGRPVAESVVETATWPRRMGALLVDWLACVLVVSFFIPVYGRTNDGSTWVLVTYVVEATLFTSLAGGSFGQLLTRLRVVAVPPTAPLGAPVSLLRSLLRHVLVALVIPPLVFRPDGRGLHDLAAGSACVSLQTFRRLHGKDA